ncbi:F-box only protein 4-like [Ptychodera flava]|uniref:F-box only protein 4-like n=1 Tax=Ptychodera flava TaxID=63121 RepID=UPI003969C990
MYGNELSVNDIRSILEKRKGHEYTFDLPAALSSSFSYAMKLYHSVTQNQSDNEATTIVTSSDQCESCEVLRIETGFYDLPVYVQLYIFSFLSATDLARVSPTCTHWNVLSNDSLLWKNLLERDMITWNKIGHRSCPLTYDEVNSDLSNKNIYIRCSPDINCKVEHFQLTNLLRSLFPKKPPRLVMFGPGLETNVRGITRALLFNGNPLFQVNGMFPGEIDGVGSGFSIMIKDSCKEMKLITLYSATRRERENGNLQDRAERNRLLVASREGDNGDVTFELQDSIKELCKTVDGFIFVVEATADSNFVDIGKPELSAMMNELNTLNTLQNVPLLVLSCVTEATIPRKPCIEVANKLQLQKLNRPWLAHDAVVQDLEGVVPALNWLIEAAQRR